MQFKISHIFYAVESQCLKSLKYLNCPIYNIYNNILKILNIEIQQHKPYVKF